MKPRKDKIPPRIFQMARFRHRKTTMMVDVINVHGWPGCTLDEVFHQASLTYKGKGAFLWDQAHRVIVLGDFQTHVTTSQDTREFAGRRIRWFFNHSHTTCCFSDGTWNRKDLQAIPDHVFTDFSPEYLMVEHPQFDWDGKNFKVDGITMASDHLPLRVLLSTKFTPSGV